MVFIGKNHSKKLLFSYESHTTSEHRTIAGWGNAIEVVEEMPRRPMVFLRFTIQNTVP